MSYTRSARLSRFAQLTNCCLPIVQAPMAGISTVEMAAAVSEAGGLGSVAMAGASLDQLRNDIDGLRARTSKPFNVNFFAHSVAADDAARDAGWIERLRPDFEELEIPVPTALEAGIEPFGSAHYRIIEEMKPPIVSFHFGLPPVELVQRIKSAGIRILSSATTVDEARWLESRGVDAVIAQGFEAGGHRAMFLSDDLACQMGTLALVPQIVDAVDIPVIAAGGIADGRGIAAVNMLGAEAVQLGTAYLRCHESAANAVYLAALDETVDTVITNVISGRPTRVKLNRYIRRNGPMSPCAPDFPNGFGASAALRRASEALGRPDFSAHYCGQSGAAGHQSPAGRLTRKLAKAAQDAIKLHYAQAFDPV